MQTRRCTSYLPKGNGRTRCGKLAPCTHVTAQDRNGNTQWAHWICYTCRQKMRLPDHDVIFTPTTTVQTTTTPWHTPPTPPH